MTRTRPTRTLPIAAATLLLAGLLGDLWSIAHQLPYAFGGHGRPDRVAQDWVSHGTALGPPLLPLVVLVLATPLALARRWWGGLGDLLLALIGVAMLVGTVGEPTALTVLTPGSFDLVPALVRVATAGAGVVLLVAAVVDLGRRVRQPSRTRRSVAANSAGLPE